MQRGRISVAEEYLITQACGRLEAIADLMKHFEPEEVDYDYKKIPSYVRMLGTVIEQQVQEIYEQF